VLEQRREWLVRGRGKGERRTIITAIGGQKMLIMKRRRRCNILRPSQKEFLEIGIGLMPELLRDNVNWEESTG